MTKSNAFFKVKVNNISVITLIIVLQTTNKVGTYRMGFSKAMLTFDNKAVGFNVMNLFVFNYCLIYLRKSEFNTHRPVVTS